MKGLKTVSFVLSAVLAASAVAAFGGCAPKGEKSDLVWGTASEAAFNKEGEYSTTVTVEDASFPADLSANDITIMYEVDDDEAYCDVFEESNGTAQDGGLDDLAETVNAEIKTVTRTDEHTLGITFSDGKADEYRPDSYGITVSRADGKKEKYILAKFEVNYPEYTMTSAISSVSAEENPIRITLTLDEGAFAGDVSPEQISLGGAFRGLTVQSVSAAGKNLTMQLSGKIEKDEYSNAYLNGVIKVDKTAVENCRTDFKVKIPVESEKMCLDPETLELLGDNVTVDVVLGGYRFSGTASADSFKILGEDEEGDTVGFYAVSGFVLSEDGAGNRATLTIGGTDAKSKTEAAETLYGKTLEVAASAIANATEKISSNIELCPASFYPVFDYAEVKDGKFNMTVELYAQNGVFAETLNKNAVTFAKDFESASVTSLTRTNDYTAELVFSVPTDKTSVEDMDLDGTITLAEGSLISAWGEGAPESSYTREYDQDSMGRLFTDMEVGQLKDIVGGFGNTVFGSVVDSLSGIASVGSTIYTGLEVLGVIESEKNKLDKIYSYLQGMNEGIMDMAKDISAIKTDMAEQQIGDFFTNSFGMMQAYSNYCYGVMERARVLMSKEENPPKPLTESSSQDDTVQYQICKRFLFSLSWDHDCYYVYCEKRVDFHYSGLNDTKLNNYSSFITNKEFMNADWPSEDQYLTLRVED